MFDKPTQEFLTADLKQKFCISAMDSVRALSLKIPLPSFPASLGGASYGTVEK